MQPFIRIETRNLRTLRNISLAILLLMHSSILAILIGSFHSVYQERTLSTDWLSCSSKNTICLQLALSVLFVPLIWIVYRRFYFIIFELNDLKEEYAMLYKDYCNSIQRLFSTLPQYLISQKGLLIFKTVKRITIQPRAIKRISICRIDLGRFGKKCKVTIYENSERTTAITYSTAYPEEVEFLKQHIRLVNKCIVLEEES